MKINPSVPGVTPPLSPNKPEASGDFGQLLMDVLKEVSANQQKARQAQNDLVTGQPAEAHDVMIALEKASIGMQLTLQVRNKLLEAYQEINRMQV